MYRTPILKKQYYNNIVYYTNTDNTVHSDRYLYLYSTWGHTMFGQIKIIFLLKIYFSNTDPVCNEVTGHVNSGQ